MKDKGFARISVELLLWFESRFNLIQMSLSTSIVSKDNQSEHIRRSGKSHLRPCHCLRHFFNLRSAHENMASLKNVKKMKRVILVNRSQSLNRIHIKMVKEIKRKLRKTVNCVDRRRCGIILKQNHFDQIRLK